MLVRGNGKYAVMYDKIHTCKRMINECNPAIKIIYAKNPNFRGWYFADMSVKISGSNAAYGTAIYYCPFCGDKLDE